MFHIMCALSLTGLDVVLCGFVDGRGCSPSTVPGQLFVKGGSAWYKCAALLHCLCGSFHHIIPSVMPGNFTHQRKVFEHFSAMSCCNKSCTCGNSAQARSFPALDQCFSVKAIWCHLLIMIIVASIASVLGYLQLSSRYSKPKRLEVCPRHFKVRAVFTLPTWDYWESWSVSAIIQVQIACKKPNYQSIFISINQ